MSLDLARECVANSSRHPGQWQETASLRRAVKLLIAEIEDLREAVRVLLDAAQEAAGGADVVPRTGYDFVSLQRDEAIAERDRLYAALMDIASRPCVERNPDGDDQAAHVMQLIAREALAQTLD